MLGMWWLGLVQLGELSVYPIYELFRLKRSRKDVRTK